MEAGDFDSLGTTTFSTAITNTSWSTTGYNDFVLNASGLAAITVTGVSKFGAKETTYDLGGATPTWAADSDNSISGYFADETGTANDPKLVIEHTTSFSPQAVWFI